MIENNDKKYRILVKLRTPSTEKSEYFDEKPYGLQLDVYLVNHNKKWYRVSSI
jgi:hypothetical protein